MTGPDEGAAAAGSPADSPAHGERAIAPRSDLHDALAWAALGIAVLVGSITMDRLEGSTSTVHDPRPAAGLLGVLMIVLGGVLALRSVRRGALRQPAQRARVEHLPHEPEALQREERRRIWVASALCLGYGVVLIGHGLPFWAASTIYVTGSILVLQRMSLDADERRLTPRAFAKASTIGLVASLVTHVVFQELFLVRMP
ncbi:MAG: tripartite tricarboxylate transporter TctB family protein [Rubrivivax sp.]